MRKNLLITLFLVSICFVSKAQTISISSVESTNNNCAGTPLTIKYSTSGTFKAGNKFKIQLRPNNNNIWQDFTTDELTSGTLTTKFPSPNPSNGSYYYYKVVSSDPIVETNYNGISINDVPNLQVTGIATNSLTSINPFEPVFLNNNLLSGVYPYAITFSDSSVVQVNGSYEVRLYPEKSGIYSISKVSNICGVGKATGSVNITVNPVPLKIVNVPGNYLCSDATYTMTYSSSATFEKDNKFKVRIKKDLQDKEYYDVDATLVQDGVISYKITDNVPIGTYQGYQLVSSNPAAISPFYQQYIDVSAKPSVEITSASTTINYGQKVAVQFSFTGRGPFNILINDGKKVTLDNYYGQSIEVYPEKNTQYFVESFSSVCGSGLGKNKMSITVKSGVKIDSIPNTRYCTGAKVMVKIKANYTLNTNDKYAVRMKSTSGGNGNPPIDVNATLVNGNLLEFTIPAGVEDKIGNRTVGLAVLVNSVENIYTTDIPTNQSYSNALKILEKPRVYINNFSAQTFSKPSVSNLNLNVRGGGKIIFELGDGNKYIHNDLSDYGSYSYPTIEVYTQKTTTYSLKSVSNECGVGTITQNTTQTVNITNSQTNLVFLKSSDVTDKSSYCIGEKIKFELSSEGTFDGNSEWNFEISPQNSSQSSTNFLSTKDKSSELTLPNVVNAGLYRIRAYSTNPLVYSNYLYVFMKTKPSAFMGSYNIVNGGEKLTGGVNLLGGAPYEVEFSDNTKRIVGREGSIGAYENNEQYFERENVAVGVFELKSISNACGVGTINPNSTKINILGTSSYSINIIQESYNNGGVLCYPLNLAFSVNFNIPKAADVPYSVQISPTNDTNFVNLATAQKGNRFSMILPDKYKASGYRIRVVSEDVFKIKSNIFTIQTGTNIAETTMSLSSSAKVTETTINGGSGVIIFFQNVNDNTSYVLKDNFNRFYAGNAYVYSSTLTLIPSKTTTYSLKSVSSNCGYSKASGSVKIIIKPSVNAFLKVNNTAFCPNSDVGVSLTSFGDFEKDNVIKTYIYKSGDTTTIREVFSANIVENYSFKIPNDLLRGNYTLRIKTSNPASSRDFASISVSGLPDITLSGGSIINAGSSAYLTLTPKDFIYEELEYELSDKTTGKAGNTYNSNGKYFSTVTPKITTTYTLNSIKNQCGVGKFAGSATIEVNPISDKQVNFDSQNFYSGAFCTGSNISIPFITKGTFSATNVFTVQMSDAQGKNFKDLKTEGTRSPLIATTPVNTPAGGNYLFRVVASDKDATSTTNQFGATAYIGATARFDTASYYFSEGKPVKINVKLTGTAPYYFSVGTDEISAKNFSSSKPIYELVLTPTTPAKFKLFAVSDGYCGRGSVIEPSVVSLELITANENFEEMQIRLFPNPTSDIVYINSDGKRADIELVDITGISVLQKQIKTEQEELNISNMKAGTYFLRVSKNDKQAVFKVVKW